MRKAPEGESRNGAIKASKRACAFSIFLCCFCGVFRSRRAAGLWSEKCQSERQLFFSTSAKRQGQLCTYTALGPEVSRGPSSQNTDVPPLASTSVGAKMRRGASSRPARVPQNTETHALGFMVAILFSDTRTVHTSAGKESPGS